MKKSEAFAGAVTFSVLTAAAITLSRLLQLHGDHIGAGLFALGSVVFGIPACAFTYLWSNPSESVPELDTDPIVARDAEADADDKHWLHRPEKLFAAYQLFK